MQGLAKLMSDIELLFRRGGAGEGGGDRHTLSGCPRDVADGGRPGTSIDGRARSGRSMQSWQLRKSACNPFSIAVAGDSPTNAESYAWDNLATAYLA